MPTPSKRKSFGLERIALGLRPFLGWMDVVVAVVAAVRFQRPQGKILFPRPPDETLWQDLQSLTLTNRVWFGR